MKNTPSKHGFTLVEILVTLAVSGMLMTGVLSFYIQSLKSMYASDQRTKLASQISKFSNELIVQASRSNQFVLFKTAAAADFDGTNTAPDADNSDRQSMVTVANSDPLHPAGDFVVFVYYEIPKPTAETLHRISKLEGYYLSTTSAGGTGPLKKVLIDLTLAGAGGPSTSTVESILTTNWNAAASTWKTANSWVKVYNYFPLVRGLAIPEVVDGTPVTSTPTPRLFYTSASRNVIITGQIYSSNKNIVTNDWKTYTNSFCFNITPRT